MAELTCTSCKRKLTNIKGSTTFKCPSCGKHDINRCLDCKKLATRYNCPDSQCGFSGPN
ncbi:MAG TPA: zinc finger domain-containing protein [Candidatus Nanoarchaeia archaeon]|nr:zinc finger domain-containing protein [Candidatus Nanoarchaeia archaeon]